MRGAAIALSWAVAACGGAAPRGPSDAVRAEIAAAETAERARQHHAARAHYERAIASARDPNSAAFARREFAETLMSWGEYPEAIAQLERAVAARSASTPESTPESKIDTQLAAAAWHDLGLLRHNRGDVPGAIAALSRARALAARDPRPRIALAALLWKSGDRAGAAAEYRALLELDLPARVRTKVEWALGELAKP